MRLQMLQNTIAGYGGYIYNGNNLKLSAQPESNHLWEYQSQIISTNGEC